MVKPVFLRVLHYQQSLVFQQSCDLKVRFNVIGALRIDLFTQIIQVITKNVLPSSLTKDITSQGYRLPKLGHRSFRKGLRLPGSKYCGHVQSFIIFLYFISSIYTHYYNEICIYQWHCN